jgi:hypothetical protein
MQNHIKEFKQEIRKFHRHNTWKVFADFCELSACSLSNCVNVGEAWDRRENQYRNIIPAYTKEELSLIAKLFALTVEALECEAGDFLGAVFMDLELGNHWKGQFFTPYSVCRLMADITYGDSLAEVVACKGFVTLCEPASGAGAMVIAFSEAMKSRLLNPQMQLHATCTDVDATAAHMAYIQLSLLNIPATVNIGNTLSLEIRDTLHTPAHVLGGWSYRLRTGQPVAHDPMPAETDSVPETPSQAPRIHLPETPKLQISLFD